MRLATLCYIKKDGKTLMLHRVKKENDMHEGKWVGLGGKMEQGETPEECVIREIKEESGLELKNPKLKGRIIFPDFSNTNEDYHVYIFIANEFEGDLIDSPEGNLKWIDDSEIYNLNMWEGDEIFIKALENSGFFSGKFTYDKNNKLLDYNLIFHE